MYFLFTCVCSVVDFGQAQYSVAKWCRGWCARFRSSGIESRFLWLSL